MPLGAIVPILVLRVGAVLALVIGIFLPRERQTYNAAGVALIVLLAGGFAARDLAAPPGLVFHASFAADRPLLWTTLVILAAVLLVIALSVPVFRRDRREAEYYVLLLFSALGAIMLAGAHDVMEIVLGVLLSSVGSYALVAYRRTDPLALEGLLKYYLFGALTNIGLILGLVLLYGLTGSTLLGEIGAALGEGQRIGLAFALTLVIVGLGFKAGYVPAHFWIPDVYQGTTVPVAAYLSVVPKITAILALARVVGEIGVDLLAWPVLIAVISALTMTWGNLAAFRQEDVRRLLGYSTIAQTGYLLMGVTALEAGALAMDGLLYYFVAYFLANVGAFAVLAACGRFRREELAGLIRTRPGLVIAMGVALLSLTGVPPLAGFVGKFMLFSAAVDAGFAWLTVLGVANSALSLFYYLRVIGPMLRTGEAPAGLAVERGSEVVAWVCLVGSIAAGVGAFALI